MSEAAIRISDFYFEYLNSDLVLKDINLTIKEGSLRPSPVPAALEKPPCARP